MLEAILVVAVLAAAWYWRKEIIAWFKKQDTTS